VGRLSRALAPLVITTIRQGKMLLHVAPRQGDEGRFCLQHSQLSRIRKAERQTFPEKKERYFAIIII